MAHFAQVIDGTVAQVVVVNNDDIDGGAFPESEAVGQQFLAASGFTGDWLQCSYSGSFRGCYPGAGYTYDQVIDEFIAPTPLQ